MQAALCSVASPGQSGQGGRVSAGSGGAALLLLALQCPAASNQHMHEQWRPWLAVWMLETRWPRQACVRGNQAPVAQLSGAMVVVWPHLAAFGLRL